MNVELFIRNSIVIDAPPEKVWDALVNPRQTRKYMFGCEAMSDWKKDSSLTWKMLQEGKEVIAVKGKIVDIRPPEYLSYTTIDPNGDAEDIPENYLTVVYELDLQEEGTLLTITQGNYAAVGDGDARYKKAAEAGGWNTTLALIKELVEREV